MTNDKLFFMLEIFIFFLKQTGRDKKTLKKIFLKNSCHFVISLIINSLTRHFVVIVLSFLSLILAYF